jgi:hypothetical protein
MTIERLDPASNERRSGDDSRERRSVLATDRVLLVLAVLVAVVTAAELAVAFHLWVP